MAEARHHLIMTDDQKAIEVLTRCGQWSHVGAASFLKDLVPPEVAALAQLYDDLAAADAIGQRSRVAPGAQRPALSDEEKKQLANATTVGDRYRQWIDAGC
jgi:hypothetical protein